MPEPVPHWTKEPALKTYGANDIRNV